MINKNNDKAIIILHEIYGVNAFIKHVCESFESKGYAVVCPDLLKRPAFSYEKSKEAYTYFFDNVGFEVFKEINSLVNKLKKNYKKVFILGFSVGATIAWRCSENPLCDGVVGLYGSRIRDYKAIMPCCPTLLLFAAKDSFDVDSLIKALCEKPNLRCVKLEASHGFFDEFSKAFDKEAAKTAKEEIESFLK